jgi:hypothetical protein
MTRSSLLHNPTTLKGNNTDVPAAEEESVPGRALPQNAKRVRIFCAGDAGVVKIHVPAGKEKISTNSVHIDDVAEHNPLSSTSTKSDHDVGWTHELHSDDPRNWPTWRKWTVTMIVSSISLCS